MRYNLDVTVNLPDDTEDHFTIREPAMGTILDIVDKAHPDWTSLVVVVSKLAEGES